MTRAVSSSLRSLMMMDPEVGPEDGQVVFIPKERAGVKGAAWPTSLIRSCAAHVHAKTTLTMIFPRFDPAPVGRMTKVWTCFSGCEFSG